MTIFINSFTWGYLYKQEVNLSHMARRKIPRFSQYKNSGNKKITIMFW